MSNRNLLDIRIGTMASLDGAAGYIKQILPHGFESFQLTAWEKLGSVNVEETAKQVLATIGDQAVISSVGVFGNPLMKPDTAADFGKMIDKAKLFGCDLVIGFAGAMEGQELPESMPQFKKVWGELAKRAKANGVKIGFENCDMGGNWHRPQWNIAHAPTAWDMMFNELGADADVVGLCWEPCHQMNSLVDPLPQLKRYIHKVFHVHGKDATIDWDAIKTYGIRGGRNWVWHRTPGFGDTNWTDLISILRMNNWKGSIDIEGWHDPVYKGELEMTGQVHALNYLKSCRGGAKFIPNPTK
jgi:sugar phosphate isomerase/epimerase